MNIDIDTPEGMLLACVWQDTMVEQIKVGGVWFVPRSNSTYQIDHKRKVATRIAGGEIVIERVFDMMGWTVEQGTLQ